MPEGPEVRRAADQIERAVAGKTAHSVFFAHEHLEEWEGHLSGDRVTRVETFSKALVVVFECGYAVYTHNQLYGKWWIRRTGTYPKTKRSLRFSVETDDKSALLYSASEISVLHIDELPEHSYIAKLGPDPLRPETSREVLRERVSSPRFARRQLAALLLDQSFVAGIGNYLRSEIAFEARVDPVRRLSSLDANEQERLADAIHSIVQRAYRKRGLTTDPALAKEKKDAGWQRRDYRHYVFARAGKACFVCGSDIERIEAANRRLYRCLRCQS
ncbi:MAG: endonuclease VIII [Myxococcota bacterium]